MSYLTEKRKLSFSEFMELQNELNLLVMDDWKTKLNINDFRTAMFDEMSELLNSFKWKWWKHSKSNPDIWNMKIEVIDIFHFWLSTCILHYEGRELPKNCPFECYNEHVSLLTPTNEIDRNVFANRVIKLMNSFSPCDMNDWFDSLGMNGEEISAIYVAKYTLNKIRQRGGYREGTYQKVIGDHEDNVYLRSLVSIFLEDKTMSLEDMANLTIREFERYEGGEADKEITESGC